MLLLLLELLQLLRQFGAAPLAMDGLTTTDEEEETNMLKLALIGDSGVGKTCILLRFAEGGFSPDFMSTVG